MTGPGKKAAVLAGVIGLTVIGLLWYRSTMPKHLVFVGDSLTAWYDWQKRFPDSEVTNLGIAGEATDGLLARSDAVRSRISTPDYLFLMTGINDIAMGRYGIEQTYSRILDRLMARSRRSVLVIQSILPIEIPGIDNSIVLEANRKLRQMARERHAEYLDVYGRFVDGKGQVMPGLLDEDGVHLTPKGYEVWSSEVERFLQERPH